MRSILILLSFLATFSFLNAQSFIVNNVTLFDGEEVIENTSVLVENGMVTKVAKKIQNRVQQIDGSGKFLMPGMTNSHVHAFMQFNLTEAAKAGVLNLLDMHGLETFQPMMAGTRDSTNLARYFYAGYAATAPEGHGTQFGFPVPTISHESQAAQWVKARVDAGVSYIKIIKENRRATLSHDIVKAVIDAAHDNETIAVVHISTVENAYKVLNNNADGLVHIWWDKKMDDSKLNELAANKKFFVIPTLLTSYLALEQIRARPNERELLSDEAIAAEVKRLYDAGIPILAGTDPPNVNINYGTDIYKELEHMSAAGIPNLDVLKGGTSYPAKFFDLGNIGYIKEGYSADMILLNANPIKDIQNISDIHTIWKKGEKVKRDD